MEAKLPTKGEWFTRSNRGSAAAARYADRPTDTIRVADVNEAAGEIHCERFDGFDAAGAMVIGRRTTIRFATWLSDAGRYTPCDPPAAPVPEMPPVAVFVPPEPTLADVLASNEALRGEVAGLRADFRALMKAIEAGGQLRLFPVAA